MKEEHITKVQALLSEWNPLGKQVTQLSDLNNYEAEAIDILFYIEKNNTVKQIGEITNAVLNDAFDIDVDPLECQKVAKEIHLMLNKK